MSISAQPLAVAGSAEPEDRDILVVDDNVSLRTLLSGFLQSHGYRAESAGNGRQAVRLLARHSFKLIVTDIYMPEADGLELIMHLRSASPKPYIVAMSGDGSPEPDLALNTARLLGASHLLVKPFALSELLARVRGVLGGAAQFDGSRTR